MPYQRSNFFAPAIVCVKGFVPKSAKESYSKASAHFKQNTSFHGGGKFVKLCILDEKKPLACCTLNSGSVLLHTHLSGVHTSVY